MATQVSIRWRRSAAERHALERVAREIRASDPNGRRKYLRDFAEAYRSYEAVLSPAQLDAALRAADVLLVGDYHALPASQRYAAELLHSLAADGRPIVLGLEMVFARDQHILDEWMRGDIDEQELRERIRFDLDWGYDWAPFRELLLAARARAAAVYGLDCMPRDDMRRIAARDRHAADKLAEIRRLHPEARLLVLFGESHLAPTHLPLELRQRLPRERTVTLLQNVDELYWRAAGERRRAQAVRVADDVLCVFTATPLEKYENYRLCLERWKQQRAARLDFAPTVYNLIDALLRFLNIDKYAPSSGAQPRFLVDLLPEVYSRPAAEGFRKLLTRKGAGEIGRVLQRLETRGSCYLPRLNAVFVTALQIGHGAEDAAQFVHQACRGELQADDRVLEKPLAAEDLFYSRTVEEALAHFGARVLYPPRAAVHEHDLYALYTQPREVIEQQGIGSYREAMQLIDFLVLHKDYEQNLHAWLEVPPLIREGVRCGGEGLAFATGKLGQMLGSELYDAYVAGRVSRRFLRSLFFRRLDGPGEARTLYFTIVRRVRVPRKRLLAA